MRLPGLAAANRTPWSESGTLDSLLNQMFGLNEEASRVRGYLLVPYFLAWPLLGVLLNWQPIRLALYALFDPSILPTGTNAVLNLALAFMRSWFAPALLIHMLALYLPFAIAWLVASAYLAEIFELGNASVAQHFISQSAFHYPAYEKLIINSENIKKEQGIQNTIIQVGGPGRVQVNLEYAAIFERIDGATHLVGPTMELPGSAHVLEGFERLRTVISLQDHHYRFPDIQARTKEGIRVNLQDVEILFSVQRDRSEQDLQRPYPFSRAAVHRLVYHHRPIHWAQVMIDLVQSDLLEFVRNHTLGELLAAVGEPEINHQIQLEKSVQKQIWRNRAYARAYRRPNQPRIPRRPRTYNPHGMGYRPRRPASKHPLRRANPVLFERRPAPTFVPRAQLSNFFRDFAKGFPRRAQLHGVALDWINVGTFYTPQEIIPKQHLEAWQLTSDNLSRCNERVLGELRSQERLRELARLLHSPVEALLKIQPDRLQSADQVAALIENFDSKLHLALDSYSHAHENPPRELLLAAQKIREFKAKRSRTQGHYL